jgi:HEAT repeat protein
MSHVVATNILPTAAWRKSIELNVPNLIALLKDNDSSVRASAAKALPILAGHGVL